MKILHPSPRIVSYALSAGLVVVGAMKLITTGSWGQVAELWTAGGTIILMVEAAIGNSVALAEHNIHETEHKFQQCTANSCPVLRGVAANG